MLIFNLSLSDEKDKPNKSPKKIKYLKKTKDRKFLEDLYQKYHPRTYRRIFMICKDEAIAQDIMQNTWLNLIKYIKTLQGMEDSVIESFVLRMACYQVQHFWRSEKKQKRSYVYQLEDVEHFNDTDIFEQCDTSGYDEIVKCIQSLDKAQRDVLNLHYLHDHSIKEIAEILNISESATASRLTRGRQNLIKLLKERGYDYGE